MFCGLWGPVLYTASGDCFGMYNRLAYACAAASMDPGGACAATWAPYCKAPGGACAATWAPYSKAPGGAWGWRSASCRIEGPRLRRRTSHLVDEGEGRSN